MPKKNTNKRQSKGNGSNKQTKQAEKENQQAPKDNSKEKQSRIPQLGGENQQKNNQDNSEALKDKTTNEQICQQPKQDNQQKDEPDKSASSNNRNHNQQPHKENQETHLQNQRIVGKEKSHFSNKKESNALSHPYKKPQPAQDKVESFELLCSSRNKKPQSAQGKVQYSELLRSHGNEKLKPAQGKVEYSELLRSHCNKKPQSSEDKLESLELLHSPPNKKPKLAQDIVVNCLNQEELSKSTCNKDQSSSRIEEISTKVQCSSSKSLALAIPKRLNLLTAGTKGRRIPVEANHLALTFQSKMPNACQYDVEITPDKPKFLFRKVIEKLRKDNFSTKNLAYDGNKILYTSNLLPIKENSFSAVVKVMEDDCESIFTVSIKLVSRVNLNRLKEYVDLMRTGSKIELPLEAIQCLDVVLRSASSLRCISVGHSFFNRPNRLINLGEGMEMYTGIYQSAVIGWKPYLNVDVTHKPFPRSCNVEDLILEFCKNDIKNTVGLKLADKFLRNLKISYSIPGDPSSKRRSRVNELVENSNSIFLTTGNGVNMSVNQYYRDIKNYKLLKPHYPCLWVGNKHKQIMIPAELCAIVEGQVTHRSMTPMQTSQMIKQAATSTAIRKRKIMDSVAAANFNSDKTVKEFGVMVSDKFAQIEARVLDPPALQYANTTVTPNRGVWRSAIFSQAKNITNWAIVSLDERTKDFQLLEFAKKIIFQGKKVGMVIQQPRSVISRFKLSNHNAKNDIKQELQKLKKVDIVVVILPDNKIDFYGLVKQIAELSLGVLTQCIRARNATSDKDSVFSNILLKMNAKLNGTNHSLYKTPQCLQKPCIIMGADVTHPSPESNGTVPSVAAVTASYDRSAFKYSIAWRLQPPRQEIITDLANIVKQHLIFFFKQNRVKPLHIIFYRDGVSEGQFEAVLRNEVIAIRQALLMLEKEGTYNPFLTFIVVQKRHHTRLFPQNTQDSEDKNMNVPCGTVVDTDITHPTDIDFYMVSHASIQGVARPTRYRKIFDNYGMQEDELEELTYHLCHLFTRCNRAVSYPAPTYYAHLAASRAKSYCDGMNVTIADDLEAIQNNVKITEEILIGNPMFFV